MGRPLPAFWDVCVWEASVQQQHKKRLTLGYTHPSAFATVNDIQVSDLKKKKKR